MEGRSCPLTGAQAEECPLRASAGGGGAREEVVWSAHIESPYISILSEKRDLGVRNRKRRKKQEKHHGLGPGAGPHKS